MFKKLFVASILIIAFLSLSYSIHSFANEENKALINYSGGLLDSKTGYSAVSSSSNSKKDEIITVTDNDESTYQTLLRYDGGASRMDHFIYPLTVPSKIGYIRLKTDNTESRVNVYLLNNSGTVLKVLTVPSETKDGSLIKLPEDFNLVDVSKVALHNISNTDVNIMEFNVYPSNYTEEPSTDEPSTDEPSTDEPSTDEPSTDEPSTDEPSTDEPSTESKTVHLRIQMVDGLEREYFLSTKEADNFENWLEKRLNDEGTAIYTFKTKELPRTENLVYDKIVYYELTEL
ncbi:hypothetical protein [Niallia circulans]|uniref:hypothetical protein n=1 Tax=Niallia circulans TaxID=1397 RepID=UPI00163A1178|nr:hypothetical protein [Niallia circulans]